jgi:hypothetical protein
MERTYHVGQHVKFINPERKEQDALVTIWWVPPEQHPHYTSGQGEPGCNLIVVSTDPAKEDSYGRQTDHHTSVVHKSVQPAGGYYWCWPDEL